MAIFVIDMLSYLVKRKLDKCRAGFDVTVQEGLEVVNVLFSLTIAHTREVKVHIRTKLKNRR